MNRSDFISEESDIEDMASMYSGKKRQQIYKISTKADSLGVSQPSSRKMDV